MMRYETSNFTLKNWFYSLNSVPFKRIPGGFISDWENQRLYKLNKIITLHFHAETVNDNLPLLVYPSEETLNRQIDLLDA